MENLKTEISEKEIKSLTSMNKVYGLFGIFFITLLAYMYLTGKKEDISSIHNILIMLNFVWTISLSKIIIKLLKKTETK